MPAKRDSRLVQSEKAIIEAAISVFLKNPDAGMSTVAMESGVGRTTLYRHFETKSLLLQAIAAKCLDDIDAALKPIQDLRGRQAIEGSFALLIPLADRYRFLSSAWPEVEKRSELNVRLKHFSEETIWLMDQAKADGEIASDLPSVWLAALFDIALYAAWALLEEGSISPEDGVRLATRSFFSGCGPEA